MPNIQTRWAVAGVVALIFGVIAAIVYFRLANAISGGAALLMFVGLFGMIVGFGILFAVYRLVRKLE